MDLRGAVEGLIELEGGGSEVEVTQVLTEGEKIATITVDNVPTDLFAPEGGGSEVEVTQVLASGQKIATISVDNVPTDLFAPIPPAATEVEVTQVVTEGEKIATITVDNVPTDLYAPAGGGVEYSTTEKVVGTYKGETLYEKIIHIIEPSEIVSQTYTTEIQALNANVIFCLTARIMLGSVENYKWVTIPYFNSINYNTALMLSNTELVVISQGWRYKEVELIVQYTKNI